MAYCAMSTGAEQPAITYAHKVIAKRVECEDPDLKGRVLPEPWPWMKPNVSSRGWSERRRKTLLWTRRRPNHEPLLAHTATLLLLLISTILLSPSNVKPTNW
eukprot:TRINITY_DN980_c0_g1_i2.p1 TRINITY_DN980_c0_g1~~TRINITY_DN980_c0_g1_i2.p1  ORF type:complete len:102 (+),score=4.89 TRINITY_DN980_c0_g1_i2:89-394(+)